MPIFCFDMDDTLFSENQYVESGLRAVGAWVEAHCGDTEDASTWLIAEWRKTHPQDLFQRLLRRKAADPSLLATLIDVYRMHTPAIEPRPGIVDLLAEIVRQGGQLAMVSDGHLSAQQRKWEALDLPFEFQPLIFTDVLGRRFWKPHPLAFTTVAANFPNQRCIYVADNPEKDFLAPNWLGWATIGLRHPDNLHPFVVRTRGSAPQYEVWRPEDVLAVTVAADRSGCE